MDFRFSDWFRRLRWPKRVSEIDPSTKFYKTSGLKSYYTTITIFSLHWTETVTQRVASSKYIGTLKLHGTWRNLMCSMKCDRWRNRMSLQLAQVNHKIWVGRRRGGVFQCMLENWGDWDINTFIMLYIMSKKGVQLQKSASFIRAAGSGRLVCKVKFGKRLLV